MSKRKGKKERVGYNKYHIAQKNGGRRTFSKFKEFEVIHQTITHQPNFYTSAHQIFFWQIPKFTNLPNFFPTTILCHVRYWFCVLTDRHWPNLKVFLSLDYCGELWQQSCTHIDVEGSKPIWFRLERWTRDKEQYYCAFAQLELRLCSKTLVCGPKCTESTASLISIASMSSGLFHCWLSSNNTQIPKLFHLQQQVEQFEIWLVQTVQMCSNCSNLFKLCR